MLGYANGLNYPMSQGYSADTNPLHVACMWRENSIIPALNADPDNATATNSDPFRSSSTSPFGSILRWTTDGRLHWRLYNRSAAYSWYSSPYDMRVIGSWAHYAAVLDCSVGEIRWYRNASLLGATAVELDYYTHSTSSTDLPCPCFHQDGQYVTDIRRYCDYALSDAELETIVALKGHDKIAPTYHVRWTCVYPANKYQANGTYSTMPVRAGAHVAAQLDNYDRCYLYGTGSAYTGPPGDVPSRNRRRRSGC